MPTNSVPLYRTLRATLEAEIASGRYPVGARFPTDYELRTRFGVSRHTIREALRAMQEEGLLTRMPGSGTVVAAPPRPPRYVQAIESLEQLYSHAREAHHRIEHVGWVHLGESLAAELDRPAGERWLRFAGLRFIGDDPDPVSWAEVYIAAPYAEVRDEVTGRDPIHQQIERRFGLQIGMVEMRTSAITLSDGHAARLGAAPGSAGLLLRRSYFSSGSDEPFEVALSLQPGDRYVQTMRFRRTRERPSPPK
ncbi:MAG TPA: GntR family transcriptional regulator [Hyphomicrobiales bacterium]|nr:GntR family transcriptional regulator [Hyphomicrobiales bacterium]